MNLSQFETTRLSGIDRRRTKRMELPDDAVIDAKGALAQLVDLSAGGAQIVSSRVLRPNERLRLFLRRNAGSLQLYGVVAWSKVELSRGTPRYRAGIEFDIETVALVGEHFDEIVRACLPDAEVRGWSPKFAASGQAEVHNVGA